ncbi:hypothetical protein HDV00_002348 [Rhizophlyctis rosea]|nr:hypothetical protein HDV00_002348 [Rhizophlyctis rosea]
MGWEKFRYTYFDRAVELQDRHRAAYEAILPSLKQKIEEFVQNNQSARSLAESPVGYILKIRLSPEEGSVFVFVPKRLDDFEKLGWKGRWDGRSLGDAEVQKEIGDALKDILHGNAVLKEVLVAGKEEKVWMAEESWPMDEDEGEGLDEGIGYMSGYGHESYDEGGDLDFTACSLEVCGYCGRCMY